MKTVKLKEQALELIAAHYRKERGTNPLTLDQYTEATLRGWCRPTGGVETEMALHDLIEHLTDGKIPNPLLQEDTNMKALKTKAAKNETNEENEVAPPSPRKARGGKPPVPVDPPLKQIQNEPKAGKKGRAKSTEDDTETMLVDLDAAVVKSRTRKRGAAGKAKDEETPRSGGRPSSVDMDSKIVVLTKDLQCRAGSVRESLRKAVISSKTVRDAVGKTVTGRDGTVEVTTTVIQNMMKLGIIELK